MVGVIFQFFLFFVIFFFEEGGIYFLPLYIVLNFYSKIWISFIGVMNSCKFKTFCSNNINFYLLILISTPWKFCLCSQEMKSTIVFFFILELFVVLEFCLLFIAYNRDRTEISGNFNNIDHPRLKSTILNFDYGNLKQSSFPFCQI